MKITSEQMIERLNEEYMNLALKHNLPYLFVDLEPLKAALGYTHFENDGTPTEIIVSSKLNLSESIATLRHEAAHVAAGARCKHNDTFKYWARKFGAGISCIKIKGE